MRDLRKIEIGRCTEEAARIYELAIREALSLGANFVGVAHLKLALLRVQEQKQLTLDYDQLVRDASAEVMQRADAEARALQQALEQLPRVDFNGATYDAEDARPAPEYLTVTYRKRRADRTLQTEHAAGSEPEGV